MLTNNSIKYQFTAPQKVKIYIHCEAHSKPIKCECAILQKRSICKYPEEVSTKYSISLNNKGELQPWRKSKKENRINGQGQWQGPGQLPPVIRFKSRIDRVTFELDA